MGMATFTPKEDTFRFYEDGTESGSSPIDDENTNIIRDADSSDVNLHLRILIQETGGADGNATDDWQLQYSKNGGAYTNITSISSVVKGFNSGSLTDGDPTTNRGTNGITDGTGSFSAGEISEDGLIDDMQLTASDFTEILYSLTLVSADLAYGDEVEFRVLINGATMSYLETPSLIIAASISTYYFDGSDSAASDPDGVWNNETNLDDGNTSNFATCTDFFGSEAEKYVQIEGTNAPASGNNIVLVKARIHTDVDGYKVPFEITAPAGGWTWGILQSLETRIAGVFFPAGGFVVFVYEDGNAGGTELTQAVTNTADNDVSIIELLIYLEAAAPPSETYPTFGYSGDLGWF
jgi:hypothetical protein